MSGVRYQKFCVMCNSRFYTLKINGMYCGKKCANRARYFPKKLLAKLIQKHNEHVIEMEDIGKSIVLNSTKGIQFDNDAIAQGIAHAKELAAKRNLVIPSDVEIQQSIEAEQIKIMDMEDILPQTQQTHKGIRRLG